MSDTNDWNRKIIEEFRANAGVVGGVFAGVPLLLLHTVGARSGEPRTSPLTYQELETGYAIFGTRGGAPTHPAWVHNLRANPKVTVEIGTRTEELVAREATGEERTRIWEKQKLIAPTFAEYERKTDREIPVLVLEPIA